MITIIFALPSVASNGTYDFVIITTNDIIDNSEQLDFFIHMKEIDGHSVNVVTEDDFGGLTGQYPNDRADKIRKWLIDNYVDMGIEYVLLIGDPDPQDTRNPDDDVGDIPMKMCWPKYFDGGSGTPTDRYYGDLDSDWDKDGDGFYYELRDLSSPESPHSSIDKDTFSILWIGQVMCDYESDYTFRILSDDGIQLIIGGNIVIDKLDKQGSSFDEGTIHLTAGMHSISLFFCEITGNAMIKVYWRDTIDDSNRIIPSDHLYDANGNQGGLTGLYFDTENFDDFKFAKIDSEINFEWGTGDVTASEPDLDAEVYVGRIPVYDDDYEQLDMILRKIINYETDPGDISWRYSILLPMARMDWDPGTTSVGLGEGIKYDIANPKGFSSFRIYEQEFGLSPEFYPCTIDNVKNEWKNGYGMVTWHTHGGAEGASYVMNVDNLGVLDDSKPAFTFQASCSNAHPETNTNLAYSLLIHGGIAMVAATRTSTYLKGDYTTFDSTKPYNHDMAYFYTEKIIEYELPAGIALNEVVKAHTELSPNAIRFNLYGDPECYLLTTDANEFPVADANGDYYGYEGSPVTFDAGDSYDPEGDSLDFRWDFNNDGDWDTDWSTSSTAEFTWGDDHSGTVKVEVRDDIGKTATDTSSVIIENVKPTTTLDALNQPNPQFILPLVHDLTFEGSFTDPGWEDTHSSEWDFGDSTSTPGTLTEENDEPDSTGTTTADHVYSDSGTYTVTLTITDDDGGTSSDTMQVEVVDEFGALQDINDYIQNLSDSAFKNNPNQSKNTLKNKISAIFKMLEKQKYNSTTNALINDIRKKADGHIDGKLKDDWITDPDAQYHICMKIDDLTDYLALI